jgi:hypothetical protein
MSWRCMYASLHRNRYLHMTLALRASLTSSLDSIQFSAYCCAEYGIISICAVALLHCDDSCDGDEYWSVFGMGLYLAI